MKRNLIMKFNEICNSILIENKGKDVEFSEVKKKLKAVGFDAKIKSFSWGPHLILVDSKGNQLKDNVFTKEKKDYWKPALDIVKSYSEDNVVYRGNSVRGFKI